MKVNKKKYYYCPQDNCVTGYKCSCMYGGGCDFKNKTRCNEVYVLKKIKGGTNEKR